jgi:hypothetical protein
MWERSGKRASIGVKMPGQEGVREEIRVENRTEKGNCKFQKSVPMRNLNGYTGAQRPAERAPRRKGGRGSEARTAGRKEVMQREGTQRRRKVKHKKEE